MKGEAEIGSKVIVLGAWSRDELVPMTPEPMERRPATVEVRRHGLHIERPICPLPRAEEAHAVVGSGRGDPEEIEHCGKEIDEPRNEGVEDARPAHNGWRPNDERHALGGLVQ